MADPLPVAGPVRALPKTAVHKICSGQVVLSLATAVKELVENSLDAGSTVVDVRLKNYGSELVEVTDNGPGVKEEDFQALTLKHHTSKVKEFEDLVTVGTFGFRGEALSSLCELSDVTITTRHKDSSVGCRLEYDHHGNLTQKSLCASQIGTTVELKNLFATLPVRHKEFTKNLKREYGKMLQVLYGYCLISTGVRFTCTQQNAQGKKTTILTTRGNDAVRENIVDVFGSKQLCSLHEFQQHDPNAQVLEDYGIKSDAFISNVFRFEGFVSSCQHGLGRSSSDRQFYFINGRPCDPVKISKSVNEVYHSYNRHQYPMVVLNVTVNKDAVDVNVTPDKRQLLLCNETWLLAVLKSSLSMMYEQTPATFDITLTPKPKFDHEGSSNQIANVESPEVNEVISPVKVKSKFTSGSFKRRFSLMTNNIMEGKSKDTKQPRLDKFLTLSSADHKKVRKSNSSPVKKLTTVNGCLKVVSTEDECLNVVEKVALEVKATEQGCHLHNAETSKLPQISADSEAVEEMRDLPDQIFKSPLKVVESGMELDAMIKPQIAACIETPKEISQCSILDSMSSENEELDFREGDVSERTLKKDSAMIKSRKVVEVQYTLKHLVQKQQLTPDQHQFRKFRAKLTDNSAAENELRRELSKEMFSDMQVVGQFNLGFIIAKLGNDLFIVDQHATDEKYNYEMLMKQTVLDNQKLIRPLPLNLTAASEGILIDNMDIFQNNGFKFLIDENAEPPKRVMLTSIPLSKSWLFGKEDVEELIFMLSDAQGTMCRPSRIQQMFASRACRKSIMIGTHLNKAEMRKLIQHMGELDQPWNCPHGRPTLRHLLSLNMLIE